MFIANDLKYCLKNVKLKMMKIETEKQFAYFFDNYKKDEDLLRIEEIMHNDVDHRLIGSNPNAHFDRIHDVNYTNFFDENPFFSAGIFTLPKGSKLPLHDHRNMLVFSKMIFGSAEFKSYDKTTDQDLDLDNFEVIISESKIYKSGDLSIVTPSKKNIHEITALENTAFFDVLVPDYRDDNVCNYFRLTNNRNKIMLSKMKYF